MLFRSLRLRLEALYTRFQSLERPAQVAVAAIGTLYAVVIFAGLYYGPKRYLEFLVSVAKWMALHPWGPIISMSLIIIASFPPLPGFSMTVTLCGLAFSSNAAQVGQEQPPKRSSFLYGASLAIAASTIGACLAFVAIRCALDTVARAERAHGHPLPTHSEWGSASSHHRASSTHPSRSTWIIAVFRPLQQVRQDKRCRAMDRAIRERGFPMLVLIRLCPISYGYFNMFFAAMPSVHLPAFALATLLAAPRLMLYVYSGKVLYELMDSNVDKPTSIKWLEGGSAVGGAVLAGGLGYYLMAQVKRILAQEEQEADLLEPSSSQSHLQGSPDAYDLEDPAPPVPLRPPTLARGRVGHAAVWLDQRTSNQEDGAAEPLLTRPVSTASSRSSSMQSIASNSGH